MLINQQFKSHVAVFKLDSNDYKFLEDLHGKQGKKEVAGYTFYARVLAGNICQNALLLFWVSFEKTHGRRWGVMRSFFIDWHGWWGSILCFGRRVGRRAEVAPTVVRGGDDTVVLHRYSVRGFTLSCPVKVCVPSSEGAETGSRMTPASVPDVTAQLGRLMTEGARARHTPAHPG